LHIVDGLLLAFQNRKARPVRYSYEKAGASSAWYSRSMAILGTLILLFLVMHLYHFWLKTRITGLTTPEVMIDGQPHENLFGEMKLVFSNELAVIVYLLGCFSLFWHLLHGFKSAFQSLGFNHTKYKPTIALFGDAFAVIVPIIFALMPIAIYFKWVE
jgi:succinate dehydrogenase / fumarate reductase cytochrome b subunit